LLKFALGYYQQRQEPYVIVTAKAANWASRKTIEASGGVLQEILPEQNTESLAIYHIQLAAATGI
jgi:predicted acetyltransferase